MVFLNKIFLSFLSEETASKQAGALYKPMAKIQTAVMEQKIKTEFKQSKPAVCGIVSQGSCLRKFFWSPLGFQH